LNGAPSTFPIDLTPLLQHGSVGFFELDLVQGAAAFSTSWCHILGYAVAPTSVAGWRELIHPDDTGAAPDQPPKRIPNEGAHAFEVEFRMRHQDGRWIWLECTGVQQISPTGEVRRVVGQQRNVSERKEIDESNLTDGERLALLSGAGLLGAFDFDFGRNTFWFSPGWKALLGEHGETADDPLRPFLESLPEDERSAGVETWIRLRSPNQSLSVTAETLVDGHGQAVPVFMGMHRTLSRKRELVRVVGFICPAPSVSASGAAGSMLRDALMPMPRGVVITDRAGHVTFVNDAAGKILARDPAELRNALWSEVVNLVDQTTLEPVDPVARTLAASGPLERIDDTAVATDEENNPAKPIVWSGRVCRDQNDRPLGVILFFHETTVTTPLPETVIRTNRLESLGTVTEAIAHDFNDLLTTILGGISLATTRHDLSGLAESERACVSAKNLNQQLMTVAQGGASSTLELAVEDIFRAALKLAPPDCSNIVAIELTTDVGTVRGDRILLTQVFQNLLLNALQAMGDTAQPRSIVMRAANATLADGQISPLPAGEYVELEVRDYGRGIEPELLEKIFQPYFTTRKHGTGLGLSAGLTIVRQHGGQMGVISTPGEGSSFTVFLPRANPPTRVVSQAAPLGRFRTGRILVMDDDPRITALIASMLQSLDYSYDITKNGTEAVQLYQRYHNIGRPYDAVILDANVPGGMGGEDCLKALRDLDPDVRAVMATGFDNEAIHRRFLDEGFSACLIKPFRVAELGQALKRATG
jgi:PAS domain S-box-containing protein